MTRRISSFSHNGLAAWASTDRPSLAVGSGLAAYTQPPGWQAPAGMQSVPRKGPFDLAFEERPFWLAQGLCMGVVNSAEGAAELVQDLLTTMHRMDLDSGVLLLNDAVQLPLEQRAAWAGEGVVVHPLRGRTPQAAATELVTKLRAQLREAGPQKPPLA